MVHKVLFWGGFGLAVRVWQLGIEMRPMLQRQSLWAYPMYAGIGGAFGYWLTGVEDTQMRILGETRDRLLEKRRRRDERELNKGTNFQKNQEGLFASPRVVQE
ncbi:hypothetical protein BDV97DRAFT_319491 [Delphinella strobiligena]|nr:hypothetical protein BDV97DRAFT_319491 [Delphinella strobiligena]